MSKRLPYPVLTNTTDEKRWWRSLKERDESPEFQEALAREFPAGASDPPEGVSRRDFFRLSAASAALAGVAACRRPDERILPYSRQPEEVIPGNPLFFATAMPWANTAIGLLVESHEGRPTKIEGNPRHPESQGAVNNWAQATILNMYDPDRSASPTEGGQPRSWEQADEALAQLRTKYRATQGKGFAVLTESHRSPTLQAQLEKLKAALPQAEVFRFDAFAKDNSRAGAELAFGRPLEAIYEVERAHVIVTFDSDFLVDDGTGGVRHAKGWSKNRRNTDPRQIRKMPRHYAVESTFSVTGSMADHRLRLSSRDVGLFALHLAKEAGVSAIGNLPAMSPAAQKFFRAVALDLDKNRKVCLLVAGDKQPPVVHAAVHLANLLLGGTFRYVLPFDAAPDGVESIMALARKIGAGEITGLLILGGNPVWNAPADAQFGNMLAKLTESIHVSTHRDETSAMCKWHFNRTHFLEAWGDVRAVDGTLSVIQPLIAPMFDGRSDLEVLQTLLGEPGTGYEVVRETLKALAPGDGFEKAWRLALHDGVWANTTLAMEDAGYAPTPAFAAAAAELARPARPGWEVTFGPDPHAYDGQFANNGWLQELPDPMHKLTWGNAALISIGDAKQLEVEDGDLVTVTMADNSSKTLPALIAPGQADGSVALTIGEGRKIVGRVGEGIGHMTTHLRTSSGWGIASGAKVIKAGGRGDLARTQEHFSMENRHTVREATVGNYARTPNFAKDMGEHYPKDKNGEPLSLSSPIRDYSKGHKWAMTIDLNNCIGCGGCTVACVAENNISIVGKEGVKRSREMHWIRIDRYFEGPPDAPRAVSQPLPCQQCENAPCEEVCPVGATTHSPEGLNDMAYNRCIGTKYCLNNCPFKVRRFNYFNYVKDVVQIRRAQYNPEVTVRSRGVMEKCTYCVQRINAAKIEGHVAGTDKIADGRIKTACQQACPTDAIIFGDLNDPDAKVTKLVAEPRSYTLLDELNVRARTTYLARLHNPNPDSPDMANENDNEDNVDRGNENQSERAPLVLGEQSFHTITAGVSGIVERKTSREWMVLVAFTGFLFMVLGLSLAKLVLEGIGVWGLNNTVGWAWDITGFVFWIGIGHAGTLISAILYLLRQRWRTGINRAAEAMTIFAVLAAFVYPTFHVGRVWFLYWVFPVPNQMGVWPNFKSPLLWDVFAVSTYLTVSLLFWYIGLVPDLATLRDRAKTKIRQIVYGIFSLGWRGSHRHWLNYEKAYLILAGLSTPLVLSVHTIVSFDFAVSIIPGWHTTIFPPYFVAGAIFSGFAMVLTLMIIARKVYNLEHIVTTRHLENMCKVIIATGTMVGYAYGMEMFIAWYSGNPYERFAFANRAMGPYAWAYWIMVSCNVIFPQLFWFKRIRTNPMTIFILSIVVNIGMWFERFVIIVTSLHRDYMPSSWTYFTPTIWDVGVFVGTFGLFLTFFLLFVRYMPMIAVAETKAIMPAADPHHHDAKAAGGDHHA